MRVLALKALALIAAFAVLVAILLYIFVRRSLPETNGTIQVAGLSAPVEIVRDADAIPHIFASNKLDGLYGLGYVHAQDRLWQMEFQRRIGFGRLSEVFGPAALPQDRFLRTVGFGRAARAAWAILPAQARHEIDAYLAGVNAFIAATHASRLPPEFSLLRFAPEPFTGPDVILWQKMVAWDLSMNYSQELLRRDMAIKLGAGSVADLMPPYAREGLSILTTWAGEAGGAGKAGQVVPDRSGAFVQPFQPILRVPPIQPFSPVLPSQRRDESWSASFASAMSEGVPSVRDALLGGSLAETLGSNNWVVDGKRTTTGKPLLANDPHLSARVPSIWYLAHVSGGDYDAIGATIPGTPAMVLGRNRFIAWGATNVAADVEDLYREKIDETGRSAQFQGRQEPLQIIPETIAIAGRPAVRVDVRVSRHGPLVSDAINANNAASPRTKDLPPLEPLAFRWTALDPNDTTVSSQLRVSDARNWSEFTAALRDFVVPSLNFVYADVDGHIGYYAPGRIPIRSGGDGAAPVDGSSGSFEWTGWVPFDRLPHVYDPPTHVIVTANQRPAPADYPYLLGVEWPESYRAQRIAALLDRKEKLGPDDFAAIQADTLSLHATTLLPLLLTHAVPQDPRDREAVRLLKSWTYNARADSAAAALYEAWFLELAPAIVGDELGPLTTENYAGRFSYITRFVLGLLDRSSVGAGFNRTESVAGSAFRRTVNWCDDTRTPKTETCDEAVTIALHEAVGRLSREIPGEMNGWIWSKVHRVVFPHQGLDSVAALRWFLSRSVPGSGDWSTVNVGAVAAERPYEQRSVAGYRQIVDLSPGSDSRYIDALGESGHPLSPHYDDFLADWSSVKHRRMRMNRADIESGAIGHLRLLPR